MSVSCNNCKREITGNNLINCINCNALICGECAEKSNMICPFCGERIYRNS